MSTMSHSRPVELPDLEEEFVTIAVYQLVRMLPTNLVSPPRGLSFSGIGRPGEVGRELLDRVGEFVWFADLNRGGERYAGDGHGQPAEVLTADLNLTSLSLGLVDRVVDPLEPVFDLGKRSVHGDRRFVVAGWRAKCCREEGRRVASRDLAPRE